MLLVSSVEPKYIINAVYISTIIITEGRLRLFGYTVVFVAVQLSSGFLVCSSAKSCCHMDKLFKTNQHQNITLSYLRYLNQPNESL